MSVVGCDFGSLKTVIAVARKGNVDVVSQPTTYQNVLDRREKCPSVLGAVASLYLTSIQHLFSLFPFLHCFLNLLRLSLDFS